VANLEEIDDPTVLEAELARFRIEYETDHCRALPQAASG